MSVCSKLSVSAPNFLANSNRRGKWSIAITRSAPIRKADCTANSPTGPQPHTATVSPGSMSAFSAAIQPVGKMSDRNSTLSSSMPSGMTIGPTSLNGTRTYSA